VPAKGGGKERRVYVFLVFLGGGGLLGNFPIRKEKGVRLKGVKEERMSNSVDSTICFRFTKGKKRLSIRKVYKKPCLLREQREKGRSDKGLNAIGKENRYKWKKAPGRFCD